MAVFTKVNNTAFATWVQEQFSLAAPSKLEPIHAGTQNTNYRFSADNHRYIFTVFESLPMTAVQYYAALARHLAHKGAPVPVPLTPATPAGQTWGNNPCSLTPEVIGKPQAAPTPADCFTLGAATANLHIQAADFARSWPNPRGFTWRTNALTDLRGKICPETLASPTIEILHQAAQKDARFSGQALPKGICHCDLFRDNVLWQAGRITGIIDFYFAGTAALIFDLAVGICDWCCDETGEFITERLVAALAGYCQHRPFCEHEEKYFGAALQSAALRFWLSRLHDRHFPRAALLHTPRHPRRFARIYQRAGQLDSALWKKSYKFYKSPG